MTPRREAITADGYRVGYMIAGEGPTVVLVPGLLQTVDLWYDIGYFDRLADDHLVIAVDLVGKGSSESPLSEKAYGPEAVAIQLVRLFEAEGITSATVWGYGSADATTLARRRPDLVERVVVGALDLADVQQSGEQQSESARLQAEAVEAGDWDTFLELADWSGPQEYLRRIIADCDPMEVATQLRSESERRSGFVMPSVPTLAYWGDRERFHSSNSRLAPTLPIEWAVLPGSRGDVVMAVDRVVEMVGSFINGADRDSGSRRIRGRRP